MHQARDKDDRPIGGGVADDLKYETWEVKECPKCHRQVREFYSCEVLLKDTKVDIEPPIKDIQI